MSDTPKPGLYFIRGKDGTLHIEQCQRGGVNGEWITLGDDDWANPDGEIVAGPFTVEELLAMAQACQAVKAE